MKLTAHPAAPGLGVGRAQVWRPAAVAEPERSDDPAAEAERFRTGRAALAAELAREREQMAGRAGAEAAAIFDAHLLMLEDPELESAVLGRLAAGEPAGRATRSAGEELAAIMDQLEDEYLRLRAADIRDVTSRLAMTMAGGSGSLPPPPWPETVLVTPDLQPSHMAQLDPQQVTAVVSRSGGPTSHAALLARSMGIPAVFGADPDAIAQGDWLVVDGETGTVRVRPDAGELAAARADQAARQAAEADLAGLRDLPAVTADGERRVELAANIGHPDEVAAALAAGAEGIGLFRTEFLFLDRPALPGEEEQYLAYRRVLAEMAPRPVLLRTLDVGGDKQLPGVPLAAEENPFLGLRGIRLWLKRPELWRPQLRAMLRASVHGNLHIMLPMVATVPEVAAARARLDETAAALAAEGVTPGAYKLGIMIEVPAAAMAAEGLAGAVDFFSIGTNDLTQYALAVDRGNPQVADLYQPLHPGVVALIRAAVEAAHRAGIWCGVCGELGGDPAAAAVLVGLGLDELSMSPRRIPRIKQVVRAMRAPDAAAAAAAAVAGAPAGGPAD